MNIGGIYMYGIKGKKRTGGVFRPFNYKDGKFEINKIHQTIWQEDTQEIKDHVQKLVNYMNEHNPEYLFKLEEIRQEK